MYCYTSLHSNAKSHVPSHTNVPLIAPQYDTVVQPVNETLHTATLMGLLNVKTCSHLMRERERRERDRETWGVAIYRCRWFGKGKPKRVCHLTEGYHGIQNLKAIK